jgi:predicted ribosome quality control (RQC) complex YloA/Tae2 family protein|tara:strand:- start:1322 stop:3067 length:1746 start_codon:yes stop_codon:yes gene_type:complete
MVSQSPQVMDLTSLRAVLADLRARLLPSRFEKAQQPDPQTLQLGFRTLRGMIWLELSWKAEVPRLVEITAPPKQGAGSTLAQQIQHGLRQLALTELDQEGFERVVHFQLAPRPGQPPQRTLVLELMGRHSNVLLLDERQRITAIARQVRSHQSRIRPIGTGDAYSPPPALQGIAPRLDEPEQRWRERLELLPLSLEKAMRSAYQGISPVLAKQLAGEDEDAGRARLATSVHALSEREWQMLFQRWQSWLKALETDGFELLFDGPNSYRVWKPASAVPSLVPVLEDLSTPEQPLSLRLGEYYATVLQRQDLNRATQDLQKQLKQLRTREEALMADQRAGLEETGAADDLQQQGDALLCQLSPNRETIDRAQKLYGRARKLRRAVPALKERLQHHQSRLVLLEGSETFLEELTGADWDGLEARTQSLLDLREELDDLLAPKRLRRRRRQGSRRVDPQPLEIRSQAGLLIQVGRNHRQNDWISLRRARPGDLWFHAQECPGSHVVLKASAGFADEEDVTLAADLAAWFSRARGNRRVAVVKAPVEHLQRIAGAALGTVQHKDGEVVWAEPDRARQRLSAGKLLA